MSVAVVGARGFIGQRLSSALAQAGHGVLTVSSEDGHFDSNTGLLSPPSVNDAIDAMVYLSQSPRYREVPQHAAHLWAVNVVSAVSAAVWDAGTARGILFMPRAANLPPSFEAHRESDPLRRDRGYALSKIHGEEALQQFQGDLDVTCARFFGVYGPRQHGKLIPNLSTPFVAAGPSNFKRAQAEAKTAACGSRSRTSTMRLAD